MYPITNDKEIQEVKRIMDWDDDMYNEVLDVVCSNYNQSYEWAWLTEAGFLNTMKIGTDINSAPYNRIPFSILAKLGDEDTLEEGSDELMYWFCESGYRLINHPIDGMTQIPFNEEVLLDLPSYLMIDNNNAGEVEVWEECEKYAYIMFDERTEDEYGIAQKAYLFNWIMKGVTRW